MVRHHALRILFTIDSLHVVHDEKIGGLLILRVEGGGGTFPLLVDVEHLAHFE